MNKLRRMKRSVLGRRVVNKVKRPEENIPSIGKQSIYSKSYTCHSLMFVFIRKLNCRKVYGN